MWDVVAFSVVWGVEGWGGGIKEARAWRVPPSPICCTGPTVIDTRAPIFNKEEGGNSHERTGTIP